MINRNDMLELTRRMTPARSSIGRIAGAYFDSEGYVDGTFNTNFRRLSLAEQAKRLAMAKAVIFSRTNEQLRDVRIPEKAGRRGELWQLLEGIKENGMKNDALPDMLYEVMGERYQPGAPYFCFLFHGRYDIPVKGSDGEWMEGSEEIYEYLIGAVGPLAGDYEPGAPEFGFLYPAFRDRTTDRSYVNLFEKDPGRPHRVLWEWLLKE